MAQWHTVLSSSLSGNQCGYFFKHPKDSLQLCEPPTCLKVCHRSRYHSDTVIHVFWKKNHPPKNVSPSHPHEKPTNSQTLHLRYDLQDLAAFCGEVLVDNLAPANVSQCAKKIGRLRNSCGSGSPVEGYMTGPSAGQTCHVSPASGDVFEQIWCRMTQRIEQDPVLVRALLEGHAHEWKKTHRGKGKGGAKHIPKGYPIYLLISSFEIRFIYKCLKTKKKNLHGQDISHSSCVNP